MSIDNIVDYMQIELGKYLERLDEDILFWQITWRSFALFGRDIIPYAEEKEISLLSLILSLYPNSYLICSEDPVSDGELSGSWILLDKKTWVIPDDVNVAKTLDWLQANDWIICKSNRIPKLNTNYSSKKALKKNGKNLLAQMKEDNMPYLVVGGPDDISWIILLNSDYEYPSASISSE